MLITLGHSTMSEEQSSSYIVRKYVITFKLMVPCIVIQC